jgi:hemerythrin-like metal-binding protein
MAFFEWDDSITLGIPIIDEQHEALFDWINNLDEAIKRGDGSEAVEELIWKLITYVTEHFCEEELLMLSCNYPDLAVHRKEHDQFVDRLREMQLNVNDGHEMGKSVLVFLVDWLIHHIKQTDQGYSRFIRNQAKQA